MSEQSSYAYWIHHLTSRYHPPVSFHSPGLPHKMCIVIVEPREHILLQPLIWQIGRIYGEVALEEKISLVIAHGNRNQDFVHGITMNWHNVGYLHLPHDNLSIADYNTLLCQADFWQNFSQAEHALLCETDAYIRRRIPEEFFQYDYVGAPWPGTPYGCIPGVGGNGGFSLRRVKPMMEMCSKPRFMHEPQDVFVSRYVDPSKVPPFEKATEFAVEGVWHPDPVGLHKVYSYFPADVVKAWLSDEPTSITSEDFSRMGS